MREGRKKRAETDGPKQAGRNRGAETAGLGLYPVVLRPGTSIECPARRVTGLVSVPDRADAGRGGLAGAGRHLPPPEVGGVAKPASRAVHQHGGATITIAGYAVSFYGPARFYTI